MMKKKLLLVLVLFFLKFSFAQNQDTRKLANTSWKVVLQWNNCDEKNIR